MAVVALGAVLLGLVDAGPAFGDAFTPESGGSPNADDIDTLYKITLYIAIVIFLLVEGVLIWSLFTYRARRGGAPPAQIHGNTPLEIGWTLGAAVILVVLTIVTFLYLGDIENPPPSGPNGLPSAEQFALVDQAEPPKTGGPTLDIGVNGQQFLWRYDYPGDPPLYSYYEMVVPTNTTVTLDVTASDVVHAWWVPKLGGKVDGVPGHVNQTWFKIKRPGVYRGQCAELCGYNHADMHAEVRAVSPERFLAWAERQRAGIQQAQEALARQRRERQRSEAVN
ncbi:MAG: cytochrome c oxidase subunit [Thermoleophilaceae bacterium]|nr:cytochrome c oxidase subunit [Thermoleophilaceae bacterium]